MGYYNNTPKKIFDERSQRWIDNPEAASIPAGMVANPDPIGRWTQPYIAAAPSTASTIGGLGSIPASSQNVLTNRGTQALTYTMPDFSSIIKQINDLNLKAQQTANAGRIPNAGVLENQSSGNIGSALAGKLPADVIQQLGQRAAERGIGTGTAGSMANDAAYMRALGLNSLDLQNMGQTWLNNAYSRNPAAPVSTIDPSTLYASVGQQLQSDLALRNLELQQQELAQRYDLAMREMANRLAVAGLQHQGTGNARTSPYAGGGFMPNGGGTPVTGSPYIYTGSTSDPNATATMGTRNATTGTATTPYNPVPAPGTTDYLNNLYTGNNLDYTGYNPFILSDPFAVENSWPSTTVSPGWQAYGDAGIQDPFLTANTTPDWFNQDWLYGG